MITINNSVNEISRSNLGFESKLDLIYEKFDKWLWASEWDRIDKEMRSVDWVTVDLDSALTVLTVTLVEKSRFPSRPEYCKAMRNKILNDLGPDRLESIMMGLE